ncbi:MAG TPA: short chain dehydrogenase [Candidatus Eisenbacteria bacterium]|nr:short chain dehydrogenase [Candidatus Eisenbacteria bacterium]
MRIIVIGATGTLGQAVVRTYKGRHEIVQVGHTRGEHRVDITDKASIESLFEKLGAFDALVSAAGQVKFGPLAELTDEDWNLCISDKLMGQVNLVRVGLQHVREGGSFTLTSGLLSRYPVVGGSAITLVNAALEAFVKAAALEMPRGVRINVVSPPWVSETLQSMGRDPSKGLPAEKVAKAYVESIEGKRNGETLDARDFA